MRWYTGPCTAHQPSPDSFFSQRKSVSALTEVEPLINICKLFSYPRVRGAIQICGIMKEQPLRLNSFSSAEKKDLLREQRKQ